jgi:hypothetical protein
LQDTRYSLKKSLRAYVDFFFSNEWGNNIKNQFPLFFLSVQQNQILFIPNAIAKHS